MISIIADIPESVFEKMKDAIASSSGQSQDIFAASAIALALMQKGVCDRAVTEVYVNGIVESLGSGN